MNLAIISQPPILASAPQALFLPKMLSIVRAHNLRVRFCKSNGRERTGLRRVGQGRMHCQLSAGPRRLMNLCNLWFCPVSWRGCALLTRIICPFTPAWFEARLEQMYKVCFECGARLSQIEHSLDLRAAQ